MTAVPNFADAFDTSLPGIPFANGSEGEAWMWSWCGTCEHGNVAADGCALTDVAIMGRIPAAWIELDATSPQNRYLCQSWSPAAGVVDLMDRIGFPT